MYLTRLEQQLKELFLGCQMKQVQSWSHAYWVMNEKCSKTKLWQSVKKLWGEVKRKIRSRWRLKPFCSEPASRLRENQNKEKEFFLKIALSLTSCCNASSQQEILESLA